MDTNRSIAPAAWASWVNAIAGIWLIISPWVLGFAGRPTPFWNTLILGIVVLIAALWATQTVSAGPSWLNLIFGIWLIISPFVLAFSAEQTSTGNDIICGIIVGILGLAAALTKTTPGRRIPA